MKTGCCVLLVSNVWSMSCNFSRKREKKAFCLGGLLSFTVTHCMWFIGLLSGSQYFVSSEASMRNKIFVVPWNLSPFGPNVFLHCGDLTQMLNKQNIRKPNRAQSKLLSQSLTSCNINLWMWSQFSSVNKVLLSRSTLSGAQFDIKNTQSWDTSPSMTAWYGKGWWGSKKKKKETNISSLNNQ